MSEPELKLAKAPIVEAVLDIDCDMPPALDLGALEGTSREGLRDQYPKFRTLFLEQHRIQSAADRPAEHSARRAIQALQLLHADEKQLVQVRAQGFSFNRLAPYTSLDDYLPEIQRTWELFVGIAAPIQIRVVRLRYINRISLPFTDGQLKLDQYIKVSPRLPDENKLRFAGFLNQHSAVEIDTGHQANIVLASQSSDSEHVSIIFDICVASEVNAEPKDWAWILATVLSLRGLKNRIFRNTLTEQCLNLFQQ